MNFLHIYTPIQQRFATLTTANGVTYLTTARNMTKVITPNKANVNVRQALHMVVFCLFVCFNLQFYQYNKAFYNSPHLIYLQFTT